MKRLLLPLPATFALPNTVNASVDSSIHKMCLDAKDYKGCINANKNKKGKIDNSNNLSQKQKKEQKKCIKGMTESSQKQKDLLKKKIIYNRSN